MFISLLFNLLLLWGKVAHLRLQAISASGVNHGLSHCSSLLLLLNQFISEVALASCIVPASCHVLVFFKGDLKLLTYGFIDENLLP